MVLITKVCVWQEKAVCINREWCSDSPLVAQDSNKHWSQCQGHLTLLKFIWVAAEVAPKQQIEKLRASVCRRDLARPQPEIPSQKGTNISSFVLPFRLQEVLDQNRKTIDVLQLSSVFNFMVKNKHVKKASVMSFNVYYIELFIMLSKMYALYQVNHVKYNLREIQIPHWKWVRCMPLNWHHNISFLKNHSLFLFFLLP